MLRLGEVPNNEANHDADTGPGMILPEMVMAPEATTSLSGSMGEGFTHGKRQ